jgi:hypothetical protein
MLDSQGNPWAGGRQRQHTTEKCPSNFANGVVWDVLFRDTRKGTMRGLEMRVQYNTNTGKCESKRESCRGIWE